MSLLAPLVLALSPAISAPVSTPTLEVETKAELERALATISADEIRSDLMFIASDALKGRDTPSPQQKIAALYIRARLERLGFKPGAEGDSYFHNWTYPQSGLDRSKTFLTITGEGDSELSLEWSSDYFLRREAFGMREVEGTAVWADDFDKDVIKTLEVDGKWVIGVNRAGFSNRRIRDLQERGAIGVLILPKPDSDKRVADAFNGLERRVTKVGLNRRASSEARFPRVYLGEAAAARVTATLPDGLEAGDAIDLTVKESCGYGKLDDAELQNVVGIWPGKDPELKKELIILSAHYDHVGHRSDGTIFNGADDNGSGTCGLMAIAEALTEYGPMRRSVMLMWVSGEEKGLLGSAAWCKDPYLPDGLKPLCNINIDMIGRNASSEFLITPTSDHSAYSALTKVAEANAESEGFAKIKSADEYWERSDHRNFAVHLDIPVAFLFCDVHEDYHKPTDTPDKIDYDKVRRICRLVVRMLDALQIDKPKF